MFDEIFSPALEREYCMKMKRFNTEKSASLAIESKKCKTDDNETAIEKPKQCGISRRCSLVGGIYHMATADVRFEFEIDGNEESIPAHKCILSLHSPYFRAMFYGNQSNRTNYIKMNDTTIDAFIDFMQALYGWILPWSKSQSKISPLLHLANKYGVNWLIEKCKQILYVIIIEDAEAVFWVLPLSDLYNYNDLQRECIKKIRLHGSSLIESAEFLGCSKNMMKQVIGVDFVNRDEAKVFTKCIKWAEQACQRGSNFESIDNVREYLDDCFELIRFDSMTQQQFVECLSINPKIFTYEEIQRFAKCVTETIPCIKQSKINNDVPRQLPNSPPPYVVLSSYLESLYEDQTTTDIAFIFKNEKNEVIDRLSAHKCVLANSSIVFSDLLKEPLDEINVTEAPFEIFKTFLQLIYAFRWILREAIIEKASQQNTNALLLLAKKYKVFTITWSYDRYLARCLNEENVFWCYELSCQYSMDSLKSKCIEFMKSLPGTSAFLDISQTNLKAILELNIWDNDKSLLCACIQWAKRFCDKNQLDPAKPKHLRTAFGDAFRFIPFYAMSLTEFVDFQLDYGAMFSDNEIRKMIVEFAWRRKYD